MNGLPSVIRSLRHRNSRLFVAGQLVSLVGTWMQSVAQAWLVYRLTGSAALLGLIGFASQIPVLLLGPAGGAAVDRLSRRRVIIATQSASTVLAVTIAALTLSGHIQLWHVFVLAGLRGRVMAVYAMVVPGITPFGALLAGLLAERLGAPATVAIGGVFCIAGVAVFARQLPALRVQAQRLIAVQDQIAADGGPEAGRAEQALDAAAAAST
jgi:hypothetical protein